MIELTLNVETRNQREHQGMTTKTERKWTCADNLVCHILQYKQHGRDRYKWSIKHANNDKSGKEVASSPAAWNTFEEARDNVNAFISQLNDRVKREQDAFLDRSNKIGTDHFNRAYALKDSLIQWKSVCAGLSVVTVAALILVIVLMIEGA